MSGWLCRWFPHKWTRWFDINYPPDSFAQIRHCKRCLLIEQR